MQLQFFVCQLLAVSGLNMPMSICLPRVQADFTNHQVLVDHCCSQPSKDQENNFIQRHALHMLQPSAMALAHHVPVPLCPSPILALCNRPILSIPLRTSPILSQSHYVPGKLCSSPTVYQAHCVPGPLCQAHCVPGPLCHRPTVSQAHCVPGPGREDLLFETAVSRVTC